MHASAVRCVYFYMTSSNTISEVCSLCSPSVASSKLGIQVREIMFNVKVNMYVFTIIYNEGNP